MPPFKQLPSAVEYTEIQSLLAGNKNIKDLYVPVLLLKKYNIESGERITWADVLDEVDSVHFPEIKKDVTFIIEERGRLEWNTKGIPDKYVEEAGFCIQSMNQSHFNPDNFVGKGAAGIVFLQNEKMELCVKYLHDPAKSLNRIYKEFELLDRASSIPFNKLRVPRAHFLVNNRNPEKSIYSMDYVAGCSVEELTLSPNRFLKLIDNNREKILAIVKALEANIEVYGEDIKMMHKYNIVHADLHIRNVLISTTGELYLIDFGNSIDVNNPAGEYVSDVKLYDSLENIKEQDVDSIKNIATIVLKKLKDLLALSA